MTPQELKNSILQLAIQGKLVEQRPEEGTAEELYQQIQGEKQRLIKAGTIKKEKPLPKITEDEKPFDIPESWMWVRLPDVTYAVGNKNNQILAKDVKAEGKYPAVSQGATIIDGYCDSIEKVITDLPLVMFGDHTRNVKYIDFSFIISADGTKFMKPISIDAKYLYYWMTITAEGLRNRGYARHYSLLVKELVPLPPLTEQKRIVAKIEELMPYIDRYEQAWSKLEDFNKRFPTDMQKSILQMAIQGKLVEQRPEEGTGEELYQQIQTEKQRLIKAGIIKKEKPLPEITEDEKLFDIPESWMWVRWGQLSESIQYGFNAPAQEDGRIKMVRISDIQDGKVLWDTVPYCDIKENEIESYLLKKNDILFARTGGTVGKSYLVKDVPEKSIYAGYLIRTRYSSLLCPEYMKHFMESQLYWTQLKNGTIATAQPNCNGQKLSKMIIPLPPLAEQQRIITKLEEILPLCEKLKR